MPVPVRVALRKALNALRGKKVRVTIGRATKQRTLSQQGYYFAKIEEYLVPAFSSQGNEWSSWDIHIWIMHHLGMEEVKIDPYGKPFVSRKHSSDFDTMDYEKLSEGMRKFAAEQYSIIVPLPNESDKQNTGGM